MTTSQNAQTGTGTPSDTDGQAHQEGMATATTTVATATGAGSGKGGRRGTVKLAAIRKARAVKMARDARVMQREAAVEAALAGFYQAQGESEEIMRTATERAQQIVAAAQERCAAPRHARTWPLRVCTSSAKRP